MAERIVKEESLVTVADAIRAKGGTADPLSFPAGFAEAISAIQAGGFGVDGFECAMGIVVPPENSDTLTIPTGFSGDLTTKALYVVVFALPDENYLSKYQSATFLVSNYIRSPIYDQGELTFGGKSYRGHSATTSPSTYMITTDDTVVDEQNNITVKAGSGYPFSSTMRYVYIVFREL